MSSKNRPLRVLVVEDEPLLRWTMGKRLEEEGFVVVTAESCQTARDACLRTDFDAIVSDYRLEDGFGTAVISELQADGKHPAAIVLTGEKERVNGWYSELVGAVDVISKPIAMDRLIATVNGLLAANESGDRQFGDEVDRVGAFRIVRANSAKDVEECLADSEPGAEPEAIAILLEGPGAAAVLTGLSEALKGLVSPHRRLCVIADNPDGAITGWCEENGVDCFNDLSELEAASRRLCSASERRAVLAVPQI